MKSKENIEKIVEELLETQFKYYGKSSIQNVAATKVTKIIK